MKQATANRRHDTSLPRAGAQWSHARGEEGSALVELALLMPVFLIMLVGAAEFARLSYAAIEVANAARAGVQYGAQNRSNAQDSVGITSAATADGSDVTNLNATASTYCVCSSGNGGQITCSTAAANCSARVIEYVQVNTSASVNPTFHVPGLPTTYNLTGKAVMRVMQ